MFVKFLIFVVIVVFFFVVFVMVDMYIMIYDFYV